MTHTKVRSIFSCVVACGLLCASPARAATPDIGGPWEIAEPGRSLRTSDGGAPPLTAEGRKRLKKNQADPEADPIKGCLPPGIPRALAQKGFPFSIVKGETLIGMMIEWNHLPRIIYMNRDHFENIGPQYLGQSVGRWQGDTLVIDTNGYNDKTWLDESGLPHTEDLHTVERILLKNANTLEDTITFEDSKIFSKPWTTVLTFHKRHGVIIKEDYCLGRTGQGVTVSK